MPIVTDILLTVGGILAVTLFGIVVGLLYLGIDRKITAHMQARIGPPLTQPFTDVAKLLRKENIVPEDSIPLLFNMAPMLALAGGIAILLYLPIGGFPPLLGESGDLVLVMYLLTVPALAMVAGGFASGSPYATVGAQREMVTMMAYELPIAIIVIAIAWRLAVAGIALPFALTTIAANPLWGILGPLGIVGFAILLLVLLLVTPAEVSRIPFDTPEAETELAGGLLVEYSGRNLALFQIAHGVRTIAIATLVVALFAPYAIAPLFGIGGIAAWILDILFFFVKLFAVTFVAISLIRVAAARLRITQVVSLYWTYLGGLGILGLALIVLDAGVLL